MILHSDHGTQYTSLAFGERCRVLGVRPSRGTVGDCYDNAFMESCFGTIKTELEMTNYESLDQANQEIREYINYYNAIRRHSAIDYLSPTSFEANLQN